MGKFECHACMAGDLTELNLAAEYARAERKLAADYASCKLANGNPCKPCTDGIELNALITQAKSNSDALIAEARSNLDALIAQARSNLDALITQRSSNLNDLLFRKPDLHREINRTHEPIIHHLPPEVSALIFLFSLSEHLPLSYLDIENRYPFGRVFTTPLTLGAVCHTWRNIVWASPYLWTNISIPVKQGSNFRFFDVARDWLTRSGQLPLSVFIYTPPTPFRSFWFDKTRFDRLLEFLRLCLSRCRRLEFACPIAFMPSFSGDAPLLEKLKITSNDKMGKSDDRHITLHSTKPEGFRLSLTGYNVNTLELPYARVNEFEGLVPLDQCLSTFKKCPNLLECKIRGFNHNNRISSPPVTHDRLKKLTLLCTQAESHLLLDAINLPGLTHLTASEVSPTSIQEFVLRSYCSLRYLRLESLNCEDGELCDMLRSTQSLEQLYIIVDSVLSDFDGRTFFKALAQAPLIRNPECLLPNLSVLTIKFREEVGFPWDLASTIFGSLENLRDPLRRPLKQCQIIYDWKMGHFASAEPEKRGFVDLLELTSHFLDEKVTRRFLDIAHEGVNIKLYDVHANDDILRVAMSYHNICVPEWYQIKESLGDPDLEILGIEPHYSSDNLDQEPELTDSEDDSEESDEDLEESDDGSVDPEMGSDVPDDSDLWYDPDYGLPPNITGATVDMLLP